MCAAPAPTVARFGVAPFQYATRPMVTTLGALATPVDLPTPSDVGEIEGEARAHPLAPADRSSLSTCRRRSLWAAAAVAIVLVSCSGPSTPARTGPPVPPHPRLAISRAQRRRRCVRRGHDSASPPSRRYDGVGAVPKHQPGPARHGDAHLVRSAGGDPDDDRDCSRSGVCRTRPAMRTPWTIWECTSPEWWMARR